jgi:hypothetical protein
MVVICHSFVVVIGISYSSKAQASTAKQRGRNSSMLGTYPALPYQNPYIADIIFMERVRSRVQHWRDACLTSNNTSKGTCLSIVMLHIIYASRQVCL